MYTLFRMSERMEHVMEMAGESGKEALARRTSAAFAAAETPSLPVSLLEARLDSADHDLLPSFFNEYAPDELAAALRGGMRHPRDLALVTTRQISDAQAERPLTLPEDALAEAVPRKLRMAYAALVSDRMPDAVAAPARTVAVQMLNRAFVGAAANSESVLAAWPNAPEEIASLPGALAEQERAENASLDRLFALRGGLYDAVAQSSPERRASLERRRRTEEIFRLGELVGDVVPLIPTLRHSGAPFTVTLRHGGETRVGVVKFSFSERPTRVAMLAR